ncbi:MAG TPA: hypothetical protein VGX68_29455 [Thermoanaerobaculia bacterium]|jgi:predicted site-specific integrase-resolvase|nr:hypothetical protein [Thermoanaerobaculia bacterium]
MKAAAIREPVHIGKVVRNASLRRIVDEIRQRMERFGSQFIR